MRIAVIGTGVIGRTLAGRLASPETTVTVGVRNLQSAAAAAARTELDETITIRPLGAALADADVVVVAIPGAQVPAFAGEHGASLAGKIVIDATNDTSTGGAGALHHVDAWLAHAPAAQITRAFCTLGWENFAEPTFDGVAATLLWCGPEPATLIVERLIGLVGLDAVRIGDLEAADTLDTATRLWFALAFGQGLGRHLAFRLLRRSA